jgi:hypothetical protein
MTDDKGGRIYDLAIQALADHSLQPKETDR